jgi:putative DNA primase/helicase
MSALPMAIEQPQEGITDAITRLAAMPPLDYELVREREAKALRLRASVLDQEVKTARDAGRETSPGKGAMFAEVVPWPDPMNADALLHEIRATIKRFIVCEPETRVAVTLWAAFTWLIDAVEVAPLAVITAPEKRCGKSQLLNLMGKLARRPLVASNITPAATFRVIEAHQPTLLIDEADSFFKDNEQLRGIINSGHTRQSAYVIRTVGEDFEPKQFSTWGAKAISGIGHLAETLMDRAIVLELRRKLPTESVERLRHAEPGLFNRLVSKLARFAEDAAPFIERARPALPEALNDRAQDNWEPLLAIADYAGGEWPRLARDAALKISGAEQDAVSLSAELLADVQEVFELKRLARLKTADLIQALIDDDMKPWATYNRGRPMSPRQLAKRLEDYGIRPKTQRMGYDRAKGYDLADMRDAFVRYLSPTPPEKGDLSVTPCQANKHAGLRVTDEMLVTDASVTRDTAVTLGAAETLGCHGVTAKTAFSDDADEVF